MDVVAYTQSVNNKRVKVIGSATKEWKDVLKALGGKWNKTEQGWTFPMEMLQSKLAPLIGSINAGEPMDGIIEFLISNNWISYDPRVQQPKVQTLAPLQPLRPLQPLQPLRPLQPLSPIQPQSVPQQNQYVQAPIKAPETIIQVQPKEERTFIDQTKTNIMYPNIFRGADNVEYQIIIYTVPYPRIDNIVKLEGSIFELVTRVDENNETTEESAEVEVSKTYKIINIDPSIGPLDVCEISEVNEESIPVGDKLTMLIIAGEWKIEGLFGNYKLVFL